MRDTVGGGDRPNIRAICAAVLRPDMTTSAISQRLVSSGFLRRPPMRPSARLGGDEAGGRATDRSSGMW
jgi:hypothetical protein